MTGRYQIFKGSQSAHCCFEATVVDTSKPHMIGGQHYQGSDGQYHYEAICECFDIADAEAICAALNYAASVLKPVTANPTDAAP